MDVDKIIAYEEGTLSESETLKLFQDLVNSGQAWRLQGHYGRTADDLLEQGLIKKPERKTKENQTDFYGNEIHWEKYPESE